MIASEYKALTVEKKRSIDNNLKEVVLDPSNMSGFRSLLSSFGVPNHLHMSGSVYGEQALSGRGLVRCWTNGHTSFYDLLFHSKDDIYIRPILLRHESLFEVARKLSELLVY
jgi:hypothetical protein